MEETNEAVNYLFQIYLGREARDEEVSAMRQEIARDARWIAPHHYGRGGAMFHLETNSFYGVLNAWAGR
ncbi:hypothetical protein QE369_000706 [Agrobacterium larrymoorei]|uniref:Uncharacterized protein n=1 Tax=Agrobacterium larrymoorei TaxID=160699 RepID=A0AAJ2B546_9HYPH|nr:hypothetical protein [Agrobacterium larrymoorei]MDR6100528.1 hypothetical protein [Agrobacterium larrymoorei]